MSKKEFLNKPEIITEINRIMRTKSRSDLISMCTEKNVPSTGTKHDMAVRLVLSNHSMIEPRGDILDKLRKQRQEIRLTQLSDGNFLYPETNLVFHHKTRRVFCRHDGNADDGTPKMYATLRESDIEYCKLYKLPYEIPEQPIADVAGDNEPDTTYQGDDEDEDEDDDVN